ncbi:hypothetical protein [Amaricoccus sp.]|uniref:hypothetical protein n=1 Tax=Amaricoccus sp. TaxID=1872485 RepID=UPI00260C8B49|nr:hypothetical protein [uncultured Amaricoccus sp.]
MPPNPIRKLRRALPALVLLVVSACGALSRCAAPRPLDDVSMAALYANPPPPPAGPLAVFHLGHSLVGRDMPAMLAQLSGPGARYDSQLGWGTPLKAHWGDAAINGFDAENAHPRFRDAKEALASGDYDAVVLTEMVEIRDAIRSFASWDYLARWAKLAWEGDPAARVYLYETWHPLDDPEGWLNRLDRDPKRYWEDEILRPALAADGGRPIYVIPAGDVLAAFSRAVAARGGLDGIAGPEDLFALMPDGARDQIHLGDLGAYLVALTHYAVLYQRSPVGLPYALLRADGTPATAPGAEAARLMQETVWQVVRGHPLTGVPR